MNSQAKTKSVTVKLSQSEYQILLSRAAKNNMPPATYLRERSLFDENVFSKKNSFEHEALKALYYCVGAISTIVDLKLSDQEKSEVEAEAERIMKSKGLLEEEPEME